MKKTLLLAIILLSAFCSKAQMVTTFSDTSGTGGLGNSGVSTFQDAKYNQPYGIAADTKGNLWITDEFNQYVVMLDATAKVYRLRAGNGYNTNVGPYVDGCGVGTNTVAYPVGVTVGAGDTIYIVDGYDHAIRRLGPWVNKGNCQTLFTLAGGGPNHNSLGQSGYNEGVGEDARFDNPMGIGVSKDQTFLIVADQYNNVIRKIDLKVSGKSYGQTELLTGTPSQPGTNDGSLAAATFVSPEGIFVDASTGLIYVTDIDAGNVRIINLSTNTVSTLVDNLMAPTSLIVYNKIAYIADGNKIVAYDMTAKTRKVYAGSPNDTIHGFKNGKDTAARFNGISNLMLYKVGTTYSILAVDQNNNSIRQISFPSGPNDIAEEAMQESLQVYPNPARDNVMIQSSARGESVVSLYDMTGKEVLSRKLLFNGTPQKFDLNGQPGGVYILKVVSKGSVAAQRVLVGF